MEEEEEGEEEGVGGREEEGGRDEEGGKEDDEEELKNLRSRLQRVMVSLGNKLQHRGEVHLNRELSKEISQVLKELLEQLGEGEDWGDLVDEEMAWQVYKRQVGEVIGRRNSKFSEALRFLGKTNYLANCLEFCRVIGIRLEGGGGGGGGLGGGLGAELGEGVEGVFGAGGLGGCRGGFGGVGGGGGRGRGGRGGGGGGGGGGVVGVFGKVLDLYGRLGGQLDREEVFARKNGDWKDDLERHPLRYFSKYGIVQTEDYQ